ncbi:MAG: nitroreductase family protein [Lawsonibacter sp.]|nr:nitroreductase family protein [Lawsonibacter sp.]
MDAQTCILTRRSVRKFTGEKVSREEIEKIVSLAAYAPSWKNTQISRYIAIEDEQARRVISERFCPPGTNNPFIISSCPVLIAQTFIKGRSGFERDGSFTTDRGEGWQYYDCGIAAQTFCLAAHDLGLSTVIMGVFDRKGLQEYLQIPEDQELMALIALGRPDAEPQAPQRKDTGVLLSYR